MSYIGQKPSETPGTYNRQSWLAAEGQTVFTFAYQPGFLDVWLNGSKLVPVTDFTAIDGTSFTLLTAAILNDEVQAVSFGSYFVPGAYTQAQSDARYPLIIGTQASSSIISTAGGTDDAITGTYAPGITALTNGMTLYVRANTPNLTTTPTFTPAPGVILPKVIVKGAGSALTAGDIAGGGHWIELQYDLTLDKWVLLNPANGTATVTATNDTSFADNSVKPASTSWVRGATAPNATAGQVSFFAMSTAPNGWLKANGAAVSRAAYASLFAAIGTTYGAGDGSTTFALPDLRGEFVRGFDDGRGVDVGRSFGSFQWDAMQGHDHTIKLNGGTGTAYGFSGGALAANPISDPPDSRIGPLKDDGINGIPRISDETRPRNVAMLACIKY